MDYRGPGLKDTARPVGGTRPSWDPGGLLRNPDKASEGHCAPFCQVLRSPRL